MKKIATIEDWKELFQKETGRSADSAEYHPAPSIRVPVYMDASEQKQQKKSGTPPPHITHHLIIRTAELQILLQKISVLQPYHIQNIHTIGFTKEENEDLRNKFHSPNHSSLQVSGIRPDQILYLNLKKSKQTPDLIKGWLENLFTKNNRVWYFPDDDFFWNAGVIQASKKYLLQKGVDPDPEYGAYIPLSKTSSADQEDQILPLTNKLLAVASAGVSHFIWDLRDMTDWQKNNLHLLFNIPEIIFRESKLYDYGNALDGSAFFDRLTGEIYHFLQTT